MQNHVEFEDTSAKFKMIYVEEGVFEMGSNGRHRESYPIHEVKISGYWIGEFCVTQVIWAWVMHGTNMMYPSSFKGGNFPIEGVSWQSIVEHFLPRLNDMTKMKRPLNTHYRLPTEAEWEYAAQGGKYWEKYPFKYAGSDKLDEVGWYDWNSHGQTQAVGLKTPNLLGLYDLSGNVFEWCSDWYVEYRDDYTKWNTKSIVDPKGPPKGLNRVYRGGSWINFDQNCSPKFRNFNSPVNSGRNVGFRLALSSSTV